MAALPAIFAGLIGVLFLTSTVAGSIGNKGKGMGPSARVFSVYLATIMLPLTMHATSAPSLTFYSTFSGLENPSLLDWNVFYAYMFLDSLLLGAPQALIGEMSSLSPSSWQAAGMTFMIRSLMAIGLLVAIWDQIRNLVRGSYEISVPVDELVELVRSELRTGRKVWIEPIAVELPIDDAAPRYLPADSFVDVPASDAPEAVRKEWSERVDVVGASVNGRIAFAGVFIFCGGISILMALSSLLEDSQLSEWSLRASRIILWILLCPVILFVGLAGYGFSRKFIRYVRVMRRAIRIRRASSVD